MDIQRRKIEFIVLFYFLLFSAMNISAQVAEFQFAVRGGLNLSTALVNDAVAIKFKPGYHIGGTVEYMFSPKLGIQSGLFFSAKGAEIDGFNSGSYIGGSPDYTYTFNELYLDLPFYATFRKSISNKLNLNLGIGPYLGYGIAGKTKEKLNNGVFADGKTEIEWDTFGNGVYDETRDWLTGENLNRFDFGVGLKVDFEYDKLILGVGFESSIIDILNKNEYQQDLMYRNINIRTSIGYKF